MQQQTRPRKDGPLEKTQWPAGMLMALNLNPLLLQNGTTYHVYSLQPIFNMPGRQAQGGRFDWKWLPASKQTRQALKTIVSGKTQDRATELSATLSTLGLLKFLLTLQGHWCSAPSVNTAL